MKPESNPSNFTRGNKVEVFNLDNIKNWEEKDGEVCIKKIEATPTPLWHDGWYRNPTSGRSNNYGVNTEKPKEHFTIVTKGGCFYMNENCKEFFSKNTNLPIGELYGGISFDMAKKEYDVAKLIHEKFKSLLNKKANCPEPIDVKVATRILDEKDNVVELIDFFRNSEKKKSKEFKFITTNFLHTAMDQGVDVHYPMSEEASEEIKKDPFNWVFNQYLEKSKQSIYRYKIDGPNTRLLDIMTLNLADRQKHFIESNNATDIGNAVENFTSKLAEFWAILHKTGIGYHSGHSEHCTLVDITASGVIMDIGGLSEYGSIPDDSKDSLAQILKKMGVNELSSESPSPQHSEGYIVQVIKTTNLISYLCKNILKTDEGVYKKALSTFWDKYKNIHWDENLEFLSEDKNTSDRPDKIRTKYFDNISGDWITLAPDLKDLSSD